LKRIVKVADGLASILTILSAIPAILMSAFVVLATVMRYFWGAPFSFTEELVGLLFTAMVFIGLPACIYRKRNISVTLLVDAYPPAIRRLAHMASMLLIILFLGCFGFLSLDYAISLFELDGRTTGSRLLLWPWVVLMPLSCFFAILAAILRIIGHSGQSDVANGGAI